MMDNTISLLEKQIKNQEKLINELDRKFEDYKDLAKEELQKGNKIVVNFICLKKEFRGKN